MESYRKLLSGWVISSILLFSVTVVQAQQVTVQGTVTNSKTGQPMIGVNILVVGTSMGTVTDVDGHYSISVPSLQDTLRFSFIGFQTKTVPISGRTTVNTVLKPKVIVGQQLVVTGYQKKQKSVLTGSVTQIAGKELSHTPTVNVTKSLEGRIAGLKISNRGGEPGSANLSIDIRGAATFGDNTPLFIIDGVPATKGEFANLSPQNIATVSVLKDASAAIYGARAANGVIVVTTKRGEPGEADITINASTGYSTYTIIPELMNAYQYAIYKTEMQKRYGRALTFTQKDIQLFKNGNKPLTHPNTDWYAATLKKWAPQSNINISASGGTEKVQYYVSGGYLYKGSFYHSNDMNYQKYQLRSNIDAQVTKNLQLGFDVSARLRRVHQPGVDASYLFHLVQLAKPTTVAVYPNGLVGLGPVGANPVVLATNKAGWSNRKQKVFNANLSANLDLGWLVKGLSLKGIASFGYHIDNNKSFANTWTAYHYNPQTGEYVPKVGKINETQTFNDLNVSNVITSQKYYNISLRYERSFGPHNINGFIAYELQEGYYHILSGYRRGIISPNKVFLNLGSTKNQTTGGTATNSGRVSEFGSISYNYKQKYMINFTLRRDGSFNFPKESRFGIFPSVSVGWNIAKESFMDGTNGWLSMLKIRSSYGLMGNDQVPSYQYLTKYVLSSGSGYYIFGETPTRYNGFYQTNTPNPDITWEVAKDFDIGLDAALFNNKFSLTFDYFFNRRRDILIQPSGGVPEYTGLSLPQQNLGKINNHGVELTLGYQNSSSNGKFSYNLRGNFSYNKNKIVYMSEPKGLPSYQQRTGHPINSYLLYKADGIFNTQQELENTEATLDGTKPGDIKYVDVNGDGEITAQDMVRVYASPTPKIQYGFSAGFSYKNLNLNIFIQGQAKAKNYIAPNRGALSNEPLFYYKKRWTKEHKSATYPRAMDRTDFYNYSKQSTFWLYNTAYIRLKNVRLSYTLPVKWMANTAFENVRVYLTGSNLWVWSPMFDRMGGKYFDPESNTSSYSDAGKYYPQQTIYQLGISVQF